MPRQQDARRIGHPPGGEAADKDVAVRVGIDGVGERRGVLADDRLHRLFVAGRAGRIEEASEEGVAGFVHRGGRSAGSGGSLFA